jgi:multiple sugar transport system substrate-binding protein
MAREERPQLSGVSRRTFLKGSAAAIAAALAASNSGNLKTQGIFAPRVVRAAEPLHVYLAPFAQDAVKKVLPEFESQTGLTADFEGLPSTSGTDTQTLLATAYAAGNSPFDVVSDSDEGGPLFMRAGWLMPLDDIIPQETWDDFLPPMLPVIELWHTYEGQRYRIPHETAVGFFFNRQDWYDEKNVKAPTTWDEMVEVGKVFTDAANGVWGTTDGLKKPGLLAVYIAHLAAASGGNVFEFDDGTAQAFQFLYDMMRTHKIFPETALNDDYTTQNALYYQDKVAFMRQWPFILNDAPTQTDWYKPEKLTVTLPPAGPAGSKTWTGGSGWDIPKFAPNPDGAKELIKFLTSNDIAVKLAREQSFLGCLRKSIVDTLSAEGSDLVKYWKMYSDADAITARPFHPKASQAQGVVEDMASLFLFDQASLSEVMAQGKQQIAALSE